MSTINGSTTNDELFGTGVADAINGLAGDDQLFGDAGNDTLSGGIGNDALYGDEGSDILNGDDGDDVLTGSTGNDTLDGGVGNDTAVMFGNQQDYQFVFNANRSVTVTDLNSSDGDDGIDVLMGVETIQFADSNWQVAGAGNDAVLGAGGNDVLSGYEGDDVLTSGMGNDTLDGGVGNDTAVFAGNQADFRMGLDATGQLTLTDLNALDGNEGTDVLTGIETIQFADRSWQVTKLSEFRVSTINRKSAIAVLSDGGFVVTYDNGSSVYGQRYNSLGNVVGTQFSVNTITTNTHEPAITALSDGGFVVTWAATDNTSTSGYKVYGQRYNSLGTVVGTAFLVSTQKNYDQYRPEIAALSDGGFVVTWHGSNALVASGFTSIFSQVYGRRYNNAGEAVGTEFNVGGTFNEYYHAIIALSDGGFVVTYMTGGSDSAIYGKRYNNLGTEVGTKFIVSNRSGPIATTALSDGGFVVVVSGSDSVYGRRYDSLGVAVGAEFLVNNTQQDNQSQPAITALSDGGFVVTWTSLDNTSPTYGIYGRRYNSLGTAVGTEFLVNTTTQGNQRKPAIAALSDGGFVVTWTDSNLGVYAQRYNAQAVLYSITGSTQDDVMDSSNLSVDVLLAGGLGDDTYKIGTQDVVFELANEGTDTIETSVTYSLVENVENLILTGADAVDGTGNELDNNITGNSNNNLLDGAGGNDTINAGSGDDNIRGGYGNDSLIGGTGNDTLIGGAGNDQLMGGLGSDTYTFTSGFGQDIIDDSLDDGVNAGIDLNTINMMTFSASMLNFNHVGNDLVIASKTTSDQLTIKHFFDSEMFVNYSLRLSSGTLTYAQMTALVAPPINSAPTGSATAILANGTEDVAYTVSAASLLQGFSDSDGNSLSVTNLTSNHGSVTDNGNGTFTIAPTANYNGAVELSYQVSDGQGGVIAGSQSLNLVAVNDAPIGINDSNNSDAVIESSPFVTGDAIASGNVLSNDTDVDLGVLSVGTVAGNALNVGASVTGVYGSVVINVDGTYTYTLNNSDVDTQALVTGQSVIDSFIYSVVDTQGLSASATLAITITGNTDRFVISSDVSYTLATNENDLILTGTNDINGTGNGLTNAITGNSGNNILNGGIGADTLAGGAGNDKYIVDNLFDVVIELPNAGIDTIDASVNFSLSEHVENLNVTGSILGVGSFGIGNNLNNTIIAAEGINYLTGGDGDDTLHGGDGNDRLFGDSGDNVYGVGNFTGNDTLYGDAGNDYLEGGEGTDVLDGGTGNDTLIGGAGNDQLMGGVGLDTYTFASDFGQDVIDDSVDDGVNAGIDLNTINMMTFSASMLSFNHVGNDLVIASKTTSDQLTIKHFFDSEIFVDYSLRLSSGTLTYAQMTALVAPPINSAPTGSATAILANGTEDVAYTVSAASLLQGFSDSDGNSLSVTNLTSNHGSVTDNGNGTFTIAPTAHYNGAVVLSYQVSDGQGGVIAGSQSLNLVAVNDAPIGINDSNNSDAVIESSPFVTGDAMASGNVLSNDTDIDLDVLSVGAVAGNALNVGASVTGVYGSVVINVDGTYTYTLNNSDVDTQALSTGQSVIDSFSYSVVDTQGLSASATLAITITGNTDRFVISSDVSYTLATNENDLILTGTNDIYGTGNSLNNNLQGNDGNNALDAGLGADTLIGGAGNDTLMGGTDTYNVFIGYTDAEGRNVYTDPVSVAVAPNTELLTMMTVGHPDGSVVAIYTGNYQQVQVGEQYGQIGEQTIQIGEDEFGDPIYDVQPIFGTTPIYESWPVYIYEVHDLVLDGNDLLQGGTGDDWLAGGGGSDTYLFNLGDGHDTIDNEIGERPDYTATDTLQFGAGIHSADIRLVRELGENSNDLTFKLNTTDAVTLQNYFQDSQHQLDFVQFADGTRWTQNDLAQLTITLTGDDNGNTLTGTNQNDALYGQGGDDALEGLAGNDLLIGGTGADTYLFNRNAGATGQDTIDDTDGLSTITIAGTTLAQLTATQQANDLVLSIQNSTDTITVKNFFDVANTADYQLSLNDGLVDKAGILKLLPVAHVVTGTTGSDVLQGGTENDTYIVNNARDFIKEPTGNSSIDTVQASVSYALLPSLENLTLTGADNLSGIGNAADNIIKGNEGNNRLLGGAGNDTLYGLSGGDTLNGGDGADVMLGGAGNDTYTVDHINDVVTELTDAGYDSVNSFISYTLTANVERLNLEGTENLNGVGNDLDNTLNGNNANNSLVGGAGNDTLQGKGGADTLEGGLGNDTYYVDNVGDVVTELANEGTDKVSSSISYTLTANVEQLFLTGIAGLKGTGNSQNNIIYGNSGNNQLFGDAGNDSLNGGAGNDLLDGGLGLDTLVGGAGSDTYILGMNSGRDIINNNDATGNDKLLFNTGINADQVWLRQLGNDLEVSIMGTANSAKVQNWYSNTANQLDSLQLADGKTLLANEVQTLVEAMAAFAVPALGQTNLTTAQHMVLDSVIVASW